MNVTLALLAGSIAQLLMAIIFCIFFLTAQMQAQPFKDMGDSYVALGGSISLTMIFICSEILKFKSLTETEEVQM